MTIPPIIANYNGIRKPDNRPIFASTVDPSRRVPFKTALLEGQPPLVQTKEGGLQRYGIYTLPRAEVQTFSSSYIKGMAGKSYAEIAFKVLYPYLWHEMDAVTLLNLINQTYGDNKVKISLQQVGDTKTSILWLSNWATYAFKDFAAQFYGVFLNHFLEEDKSKRVVIIATSGDTGPALAEALKKKENVLVIIFYPEENISKGQRKQMTTIGENVVTYGIKGSFDACQDLAKMLLSDRKFAEKATGDRDAFTSANSISLGRLLPQMIYPFWAYINLVPGADKKITASVPSGNFGDAVGTLLAMRMGLPISRILCGVNNNLTFARFLETGEYTVGQTQYSPSSAMDVGHPNNVHRLIELYGGRMFDLKDPITDSFVKKGIIEQMPDMKLMREELFSIGVSTERHYAAMLSVFKKYGIILDPHGGVGWEVLDRYLGGDHNREISMFYETAAPGKFPKEVEKAIGITPETPQGMKAQENLPEFIKNISARPDVVSGKEVVSEALLEEVKKTMSEDIRRLY